MNDVSKRLALIEKTLAELCPSKGAVSEKLNEAMNYSLLAGGKRLRPLAIMASADAVGGEGERYVKLACAIELIHTYSLIHDDLPAMDNDDYRRGRLTNHKVYGEAMAILAGDGLLTKTFELLAAEESVAPKKLLRVIFELSRAAGPEGMVGGQALDLIAEKKRISLSELQKLHGAKTGALFIAAVRIGAILADASEEELSSLTRYAKAFGLAFQITDDILDVTGDDKKIGKPVGSDEKNGKSTYVSLLGLSEARQKAAQAVKEAVEALSPFGEQAAFLRELAQKMLTREK